MKKTVKQFFISVLAAVGLVMLGIGLVFFLPYDYIKYKRSAYYKKERKKYTLYAGNGPAFQLYNEIIKHGLPIRFCENPNDPSLECGWFLFGDILIIQDPFALEFDCESGTWKYHDEEDEEQPLMSLDEVIQMEVDIANRLSGQVICQDAVVLIDRDCLDDPMKADKRMLVYENKNQAEVLKQFCEARKEESQ